MVGSWNLFLTFLFGVSAYFQGRLLLVSGFGQPKKKGNKIFAATTKKQRKLRASEIHPPKKKYHQKAGHFVFFFDFLQRFNFVWVRRLESFKKVWLVWIFQKVWCEKKTGVWKCINWCNHPEATIHRKYHPIQCFKLLFCGIGSNHPFGWWPSPTETLGV